MRGDLCVAARVLEMCPVSKLERGRGERCPPPGGTCGAGSPANCKPASSSGGGGKAVWKGRRGGCARLRAERLWANSCLYLQKLYKLVVVCCCLAVCKRIGCDAAASVHVAVRLGRSPTSPVHPPFARVYFLRDS